MARQEPPTRYRYLGWTFWRTRAGHWLLEHPTRGREWHQSYAGCKALIRQLEGHAWSRVPNGAAEDGALLG